MVMELTRPEAVTPEAVTVTPEEYEALPPNSRIELVDGVIHVMTPPTRRHQEIVERLKRVLEALCPPDLIVVREQELRMADDHRRNPDLMVVDAAADDLDGYSYAPADVVLAIEVASPHTSLIDRVHKPGEYRIAGIPHYWRVDSKPVVIHTYQLGETGIYLENGLFQDGDTVKTPGLPWAHFDVSEIVPE